MAVAGSAVPTVTAVALTTVPSVISAANLNRRALVLSSTLQFSLVASTTVGSSTAGFPVPLGVPFKLEAPNITTGAIYGIAPVGTAPIVGVFAC